MHCLGDIDRKRRLTVPRFGCASSTAAQVSERELDLVLDRVYDLNPDTPVIKTNGRNGVDPELVFGLDTALFSTLQEVHAADTPLSMDGFGASLHPMLSLPVAFFSSSVQANKGVKASTSLFHSGDHYDSELDTLSVIAPTLPSRLPVAELVAKLADLPKSSVFRVKGVWALLGRHPRSHRSASSRRIDTPCGGARTGVLVTEAADGALQPWLVNIAFGRFDPPVALQQYTGPLEDRIRLTLIGLDLGDATDAVRACLGLGQGTEPLPPGASVSLHSRMLL